MSRFFGDTDPVSTRPWKLNSNGSIVSAKGELIYDESSCGGGGFDSFADLEFAVACVNAAHNRSQS